jgi:predicted ATPase
VPFASPGGLARGRDSFCAPEDFFGHVRAKARDLARYVRERDEVEGRPHTQSSDGPGALHIDEQEAARYIGGFDARSHGESFLDLFSTRVHSRGLYLLDEPEAPLSPKRQLALLRLIVRAADEGAQFIIATHSPILLACPGARIFTFDEPPIHHVLYDELEHVTVMRNFLNDPDGHLRDLLEEGPVGNSNGPASC